LVDEEGAAKRLHMRARRREEIEAMRRMHQFHKPERQRREQDISQRKRAIASLISQARAEEQAEASKFFWQTTHYGKIRDLYRQAAELGSKEAKQRLRGLRYAPE
jgi:hypothetical protein